MSNNQLIENDDVQPTALEKVNVYGIALSESSTPYLSSLIVNECEILKETPRFIRDHPMSYSQALGVIDSFGNDLDGLFAYVTLIILN